MKKKYSICIAVICLMTVVILSGCKKETSDKEEVAAIKYDTITEGFDWGPAITKVVIDTGAELDADTVTKDSLLVKSVRTYHEADYATGEVSEDETVDEVERTIENVYVSDESGNETEKGNYITVEMEVGPDLTEGSPFYCNPVTMINSYVDTYYKISLKEDAQIQTADGEKVEFEETGKEEYNKNYTLIADEFDVTGSYTYKGENEITLKYASYVPENASTEEGENPLIIWLHGGGEGGEDPMIAILGNKVINLATEEIQNLFGETGAYVFAPQCPTMWMDTDGNGNINMYDVEGSQGKSYYTEALAACIQDYVEGHPEIDRNRIYIGGCSNGGYMTINMLLTMPGYFAAAYPICEPYDVSWLDDAKIEILKETPMWITHAKTDGVVKIYRGNAVTYSPYSYKFILDDAGNEQPIDNYSNALYDRLKEAGMEELHYSLFEKVEDTTGMFFQKDGTTPYEYMGHWSWIYTLNNECVENIDGKDVTIFEWMAEQEKE